VIGRPFTPGRSSCSSRAASARPPLGKVFIRRPGRRPAVAAAAVRDG
jgi:hypothetical protein